MNDAAKRVIASGRYGDDTLLHVNRKELEGLERIVGRPLTYNPQTGLPEAFGWQNVIPIVAGIAGGVVGGPLGAAAASGMASTAVGAAQGDDMGTALTKGLISGVTSYAGGQLLSGVGEAASGAAGAGAAGSAAGSAAVTPGVAGAAAGVAPAASSVPGPIMAEPLAALPGSAVSSGYNASIPQLTEIAAAPAIGPSTAIAPGAAPPPAAPVGLLDRATAGFNAGMDRVNNVMADPGRAAEQFGSNVMNNRGTAAIAALGNYAQLSGMMNAPSGPSIQRDEYDPNRYPERFPSPPRTPTMPGADYRPGFSPEFRYFAQGGLASLPTRSVPQYREAENVVAEARAAMLGEHPARGEAMSRLRSRMGPEAVRSVREEGGRVRGAGGGLDDLVPGTIEGRQRVRLADGEFVVPSDVVSGLGDGSTDQGARKLHEMMSRVRQKRHGSTRQPGRVGMRVMPA